jgi:hypothetical protein
VARLTYVLVSVIYLRYIHKMRTDKQIMATALKNIQSLTDAEYDRYIEIKKERSTQTRRNGGMIKGFSPIARPQRFKGVF